MAKAYENITDLGGLITNLPEDKIPGRNASDIANIDFSAKGLIQTKKGYDIHGQDISETGNGLRGILYKKNYGTFTRIKIRQRDNGTNAFVDWYNPTAEKWELLLGSLTTGAVMGFTPFNNTNKNQLVMSNGEENYTIWNGATATVDSVTSTTIVCNETLSLEGFDASGTVIVDETTYTYTGISSKTFTGVTPDPTGNSVAADEGVAQSPDTTTHSALPKGNILLTNAARVWLSGVQDRESQLYYSKVADATNFTAGNNPDDAGLEDFPDGGGPITLLEGKQNEKVIIHKEDAILLFNIEYTAAAKIPRLDTLALSDDAGATNQKAGAGLNQISYFTTRTEGIKQIERAIDGADLNLSSITDVILPTVANFDLSDAAAVYYPKKRVIYVACKSDSDQTRNNKIIAYYINRNASNQFVGDLSIDDAFVADWILDRDRLFFVSSVNQNVYEFFARDSANGVGIEHKWVSKSFTFGEPARAKEFNKLYIEGLIKQRTKIKISVLYGNMGVDGEKSVTLAWDGDYVQSQKISALGSNILGTVSLGSSSSDIQDSFAFSVPIHLDVNRSTRYKIKIATEYDSETSNESYWAISNISTNPSLRDIEFNKVKNSNV